MKVNLKIIQKLNHLKIENSFWIQSISLTTIRIRIRKFSNFLDVMKMKLFSSKRMLLAQFQQFEDRFFSTDLQQPTNSFYINFQIMQIRRTNNFPHRTISVSMSIFDTTIYYKFVFIHHFLWQ